MTNDELIICQAKTIAELDSALKNQKRETEFWCGEYIKKCDELKELKGDQSGEKQICVPETDG